MDGMQIMEREARLEPRRAAAARRAPTELKVNIDGTFDLEAALQVASLASAQPSGSVLRLDLRQARVIHDVALAALARSDGAARVEALGLSRHHLRLLAYLRDAGLAEASGAEH